MITKTAQFTPGPWVVECDKFIATPDAIVIAELNDGLRGECPKSGHFNANAQLIAAAPAMYEALVKTMKVLRSLRDSKEEWYTLVTPELLTAWDMNKAALSQAEGRDK